MRSECEEIDDYGPRVAPRDAAYVWYSGQPPQRNSFARFRRSFDLVSQPSAFVLHLFADTRYLLRCNGEFVGSGPARFVTSHPEYDSYDLVPYLRGGFNEIIVDVNFYGTSSFQTMPDGRPGFIAWGGSGFISLRTPGEWTAAKMDAWRPDAPVFSFAQGPVEICDTRQLETARFERPVILSPAQIPWGRLQPYSGRSICNEIVAPDRIELAATLRAPQDLIACMVNDEEFEHSQRAGAAKSRAAVATWIRSPRDQSILASCFWADVYLHGEPLDPLEPDPFFIRGNHQSVNLQLQKGWNLLTCDFEILAELWPFLLGFPRDAGLDFHGLPLESCAQPIAVVAGCSPDKPVLPRPDDVKLPCGWRLQNGAPPNLTPARMCAWDELADEVCRGVPASTLQEMSPLESIAALWCLRFKGEFLGHVILEVEAPAGAILDVACDDWLNSEGRVGLYQSNPFTDSVDRFILQGGRQRVELFHVRGGKFLQVTLRSPNGPAPLSLHRAVVISRQTTGPTHAFFQSGHASLDWSFQAAATTLASSTSSAYADCPWRERAMYIGDSLVNMNLDLLMFRDVRTAKRMLRQFAQARRDDGLLPACAPAWLEHTFGDYTLLWIQALHDFWAVTGDSGLVRELWPVVQAIWSSPAWKSVDGILWDTNQQERELFIDWGVLPEERSGEGNAFLNILRVGVLRGTANLAQACGFQKQSKAFDGEARMVEKEIFSRLWKETSGSLRPSVNGSTRGLHANILALFYSVGSENQRQRILRFLEPMLRENFSKGITLGQFSGHAELYFFYFLLPALATHGRPDLAELLIAEHYGFLQSLGDDTLPECFCRVQRCVGSRCHSWSGAPAIYAARHVLGLQFVEPGNPGRLFFKPNVHGISAASGRIAHPQGWIQIEWERGVNGAFDAKWSAPEGVEITPHHTVSIVCNPGSDLPTPVKRF